MASPKRRYRVGIIGTGFISRGLTFALEKHNDLAVSRILTRRDISSCSQFPRKDLLTNSLDEVLDHSDVVVECSGDVIHATDVVDKALKARLPVVTMNTEFHVTTGSYFVDQGLITEAEGDQPGVLAALRENALAMGFKPLVYGNVKGFHNPDPALKEMEFWSKKQGISLPMVTAATDGTKMQFEQAFVANSFGATIYKTGMIGERTDDLKSVSADLVRKAKKRGQPLSDYIVCGNLPARVFIVAEHDKRQKEALEYLKLGGGPFYTLTRNTTLCHLEIPKTIKRVLFEKKILMNNSSVPTISIAAIAKKELSAGTRVANGCGSFEVRGVAVKMEEFPGHFPIGLVRDAVIKKTVSAGGPLTFDNTETPPSLAQDIWLRMRKKKRSRGKAL